MHRGVGLRELAAAMAAGVALAALASAADGFRGPLAHDEFSSLLAGETMASGRFANAAHAMPRFFDTFHVLQEPTYASKYFPAHGLFLALGIALSGQARLGQWIAFGTLAASILWCLRAWVSPRVAWSASAAGVLLLADTPWASGYWSSPIACAGAALALGACARLGAHPKVSTGLAAGSGAALLALSRPWEGLWVTFPMAVAFTLWIVRARGSILRNGVVRVILPALGALGVGGVIVALHNDATTGSWRLPPYVLYERVTAGAPPFVWQAPNLVVAGPRVTDRARQRVDVAAYTAMRERPLRTMATRAVTAGHFYGKVAMLGALLLIAFAPRRRDLLIPAASLVLGVGAVAVSSFFTPNYLAPLIPAALVLAASGAQAALAMGDWRRWIPIGALAVASVVGSVDLVQQSHVEQLAVSPTRWHNRRQFVARQLEAIPGKHLVFVRYGKTYVDRNEWVQNGADRSAARVLWVHDLADSTNAELLLREEGRAPWLLELERANDERPPVLRPYTLPGVEAGPPRLARDHARPPLMPRAP